MAVLDERVIEEAIRELDELVQWVTTSEVAQAFLEVYKLRREVMADRYIVRDRGYDIINQSTGEAFASDDGRTWANLGYEGVVALQKIYVDSIISMQQLGEASIAKKGKGKD